MAWTVPPTFAAGVLSAAQLNILSDDIEYLYGIAQQVQIPFSVLVTADDLTVNNNGWRIRYLHRYLHYRISIDTWNCTSMAIYLNNTQVYIDSVTRNNYTWAGYVDVNSLGLTVGNWYNLHLVTLIDNTNHAANFRVEFLGFSPSTTLNT